MEQASRTPSFLLMSQHGEAARLPMPRGTVVLSRLGGGRSAVRALAPSVKYVLQGEEVYRIDGRTRCLRPGNFLLVEPGTDFEVRTPCPEETIGLCVYLGASEAPAGERLALGRAIAGSPIDPLASLLGRYARLLADRPEAGETVARRIVREVTVGAEDYLATFANRLERLASVKASTRIETLHRVERARAYIHAHAQVPLTLEAVAAEAALSRFHLTRSFAEVHGLPPLAYHRRLRLDEAARQLRAGEASATDVARRLGYGSLSAFTRAFRHAFGVPPGRARALLQ
ncbi:MAG: helix-turn-helix transcriptional regulator [Alphaproteobacteria bacterium]|nr:helix-turn-helix transcriptional regulator [Alphaproteobacteria bacterium]MBV9370156.1 helix-turn-helix transcriptional regulator [Alphaproteobacteria bacterium]MBV9901496.1 helix-turn-helix transcriptional regulator [Alphaproteobacteria bacterium]